MSRLLNVARLLTITIFANFISGTFLVICGFTAWDTTATLTSLILSICIILIEATNKWSCIGKESFTNILIICILVGGASAFFWFFHMIYKVAHYRGNYLELLRSAPTKLIAFAISVYLILRAHRIYTNLILESSEVIDEDATPLSRTTLFMDSDGLRTNNNNIKKNSNSV